MPKTKTLWFSSRKLRSLFGITTNLWSLRVTIFCCYLGGFCLAWKDFNPMLRTTETGFALFAPDVLIQEGQCFPVIEEHWTRTARP